MRIGGTRHLQSGAEWPVIDTQKDPLPTAEEYREVKGKRELLDTTAFDG